MVGKTVFDSGLSGLAQLSHVTAVAQVVALGEFLLDNLVAGLNQLVQPRGVVAGEIEPAHLLRQFTIRVVAAQLLPVGIISLAVFVGAGIPRDLRSRLGKHDVETRLLGELASVVGGSCRC